MTTTEVLLKHIEGIAGVLAAYLVDPATGTAVAATAGTEPDAPTAAAGAADLLHVLAVMTAKLAIGGEVEDVVVTLTKHLHIVRALPAGPDQGLVLLVTLDRTRSNLAMAHRQIRGITDES